MVVVLVKIGYVFWGQSEERLGKPSVGALFKIGYVFSGSLGQDRVSV